MHARLLRHRLELQLLGLLTHLTLVVLLATVACSALVGASAKAEQVTVRGIPEADPRVTYDLLLALNGSPAINRA